MADDALTDAEREAVAAALDYARRYWQHGTEPETQHALTVLARWGEHLTKHIAQARAEGARDALNAAADDLSNLAAAEFDDHGPIDVRASAIWDSAAWLRERAAQHEEQP